MELTETKRKELQEKLDFLIEEIVDKLVVKKKELGDYQEATEELVELILDLLEEKINSVKGLSENQKQQLKNNKDIGLIIEVSEAIPQLEIKEKKIKKIYNRIRKEKLNYFQKAQNMFKVIMNPIKPQRKEKVRVQVNTKNRSPLKS